MKLFRFQISFFWLNLTHVAPTPICHCWSLIVSSYLIIAKSEKTWDPNWRHFSSEKICISSCSGTHLALFGILAESKSLKLSFSALLLTQALTPWAFRWRQRWQHLSSEHSWISGVLTVYYSILAHHLFSPLCIFSSLLVSSKTQRKCFKLLLNVL